MKKSRLEGVFAETVPGIRILSLKLSDGDAHPCSMFGGFGNWGWGNFGKDGIDAALYSGTKCYFFSGKQYIRVTRGDTGPGKVDAGYPASVENWRWPPSFT